MVVVIQIIYKLITVIILLKGSREATTRELSMGNQLLFSHCNRDSDQGTRELTSEEENQLQPGAYGSARSPFAFTNRGPQGAGEMSKLQNDAQRKMQKNSSVGSLTAGLGQSGQTGSGISGYTIFPQFGKASRKGAAMAAEKQVILQQKWQQYKEDVSQNRYFEESSDENGSSHRGARRRGANGTSRSHNVSGISSKDRDMLSPIRMQANEQANIHAANLSSMDLKSKTDLDDLIIPVSDGQGLAAAQPQPNQCDLDNNQKIIEGYWLRGEDLKYKNQEKQPGIPQKANHETQKEDVHHHQQYRVSRAHKEALRQRILQQLMNQDGSLHDTDDGSDEDDDDDLKGINTDRRFPGKTRKTEEEMGRERHKVRLFKLRQNQRAYFTNELELVNQKEQVDPNMLAELKAELAAQTDFNDQSSTNRSWGGFLRFNANFAEMTDENSNPRISQMRKFGLKGSQNDFRERLMSQTFGLESDPDSLQLSTYDQDFSTAHKFRAFRFLNYQTATGDEGGGITNYDESATDNDFEFKSFLRGVGYQPSLLGNLMRKGDSCPGILTGQIGQNLKDIETQKQQQVQAHQESLDLILTHCSGFQELNSSLERSKIEAMSQHRDLLHSLSKASKKHRSYIHKIGTPAIKRQRIESDDDSKLDKVNFDSMGLEFTSDETQSSAEVDRVIGEGQTIRVNHLVNESPVVVNEAEGNESAKTVVKGVQGQNAFKLKKKSLKTTSEASPVNANAPVLKVVVHPKWQIPATMKNQKKQAFQHDIVNEEFLNTGNSDNEQVRRGQMFKKRTKQTLGKKKEKVHKKIMAAEEQKIETFTDAIDRKDTHHSSEDRKEINRRRVSLRQHQTISHLSEAPNIDSSTLPQEASQAKMGIASDTT